VGYKKRATLFWTITPMFFWWISTFLVLMETGMNTLQRSYKIYNFTKTVSTLPDNTKTT